MAQDSRPTTAVAAGTLTLAAVFLATIGVVIAGSAGARSKDDEACACKAELRSWLVTGRGRHMYVRITCEEAWSHLNGVVEFTGASFRDDYTEPADRSKANRVTRMPPSRQLASFLADPRERVEGVQCITPAQAQCLQRDRVFTARYEILGANSSSGLRAALNSCGCEVPAHVAQGGGMLGEYPGIDADVGEELTPDEWPLYGIDPRTP